MPSPISELSIAAWTAHELPETLVVTRFVLSPDAFAGLAQWRLDKRPQTGRAHSSIVLAGLSEILAFLVPEIAFMEFVTDVPGAQGRSFALFALGDVAGEVELRKRVSAALNVWLATIYAEIPADTRAAVAASALELSSWSTLEISTRMREHAGVCAVPVDVTLFNALSARAVAALAGRSIAFGSGDKRTLIAETPQSSPYRGIELVAFPPQKAPDGDNLYSEVVVIQTATFPDRKEHGVHILATPRIRNWGPVTGYDRYGSPSRSLDVFLPPADGMVDYRRYRHMSFKFKARLDNWQDVRKHRAKPEISARWESSRDHRVFDLLRRLVGHDKLRNADQTRPIVGQSGYWVLPRLAPGNRDRSLAGGTGVGWPDRLDIALSLDSPFSEIGLRRTATMRRVIGRMPIRKNTACAERRKALAHALAAIGNGSEIDFLILHVHEQTPDTIRDEVVRAFGNPDTTVGGTLSWQDGLVVRMVAAPAGVLSVLLPEAELTEAEVAGKTARQQDEMRKVRRAQIAREALDTMRKQVRAVRDGRDRVAWAILEMPESLKADERDPYTLARRVLAEHNILPQVVLVEQGMAPEKYRAAIGDLVRMTGTLPALEHNFRLAPAALSLIQRNAQERAVGSVTTQAFPLAIRLHEGNIECAVPTDAGEPEWLPYARAVLRVLTGNYGRFARSRDDRSIARLQQFYAMALEQIDRQGSVLVLLDGDSLGRAIPGIQNQHLAYDQLAIGAQLYDASTLPNTRLVRIVADAGKLPSYHHGEKTQWPAGLFTWGDATRTAYGLKRKPVAAKTTGRVASISRHQEAGDAKMTDDLPRRVALLDEICVLLAQPNDSIPDLALLTHRLRQLHVQFGDDTSLPFPLHELRLLGKAVTS